jgi:hypothetical protein
MKLYQLIFLSLPEPYFSPGRSGLKVGRIANRPVSPRSTRRKLSLVPLVEGAHADIPGNDVLSGLIRSSAPIQLSFFWNWEALHDGHLRDVQVWSGLRSATSRNQSKGDHRPEGNPV